MLNNLLMFLHSHSNLATGYGKISNELPDHGQQKFASSNQFKYILACLTLQYIIENSFWIIRYISLSVYEKRIKIIELNHFHEGNECQHVVHVLSTFINAICPVQLNPLQEESWNTYEIAKLQSCFIKALRDLSNSPHHRLNQYTWKGINNNTE